MNIAERIRDAAARFPDKKSVVLAQDGSFYTFREFEERSNQFANRFRKLGITPGMRTLLFVRPCLDFSVITFALFKVGAIPVLIDPGMGIKNLLNSVKQVRPEALVSIGKVHWLRRFKRQAFTSLKVKVSLNRVGGSTHYLYKNLESEAKDFSPLEVSSDDYSAILFTSGGTGIPKGVLYTHGILNAQTDALRSMFSLDETKTDLPGFPLFALFTLAMGMTSVIPEMDPTCPAKCDPAKLVKNIQDYGISFVAGSPAIWERVGRYCVEKKIKLPSVKQVVMFGAPVRAQVHQYFQEVLVQGDTFTPYGATECLPVSLTSGSEILRRHILKMNQGAGTCIGLAVPGVMIKIIQASDIPEGNLVELPLGEIGEIVVSGLQVTPGYFDMKEETVKAKIIQDGVLWHRMGDVGRLDKEGNLWFFGRKVHRVEAKAQTYYSIQVEAIFNQHQEVKRSALVDLGGRPGIVIERYDGATKMGEKFISELQELGSRSPHTVGVRDFFVHPSFPVDVRHNIKIDRTKLSAWARQKLN